MVTKSDANRPMALRNAGVVLIKGLMSRLKLPHQYRACWSPLGLKLQRLTDISCYVVSQAAALRATSYTVVNYFNTVSLVVTVWR